MISQPYVGSIELKRERVESFDAYPFSWRALLLPMPEASELVAGG